jgi:hypothetical protein
MTGDTPEDTAPDETRASDAPAAPGEDWAADFTDDPLVRFPSPAERTHLFRPGSPAARTLDAMRGRRPS